VTLVARSAGPPHVLARRLAEVVEGVDPGMPVLRAATLRELIGGTLGETRMVSILIAVFGGIALLLAVVGLYGVMAFNVARRTRELGIRVAMGATAGDVWRLVLGEGLRVAASGLIAGVVLAILGLRLLEGLLFETRPADPLALGAAAALLVAATMAAALLPARRATRIEPVQALAEE
jgi:putative ABC transport system permease protein